MAHKLTKHAALRQQQRCLPDMVIDILDNVGIEDYHGDGNYYQAAPKNSRKRIVRILKNLINDAKNTICSLESKNMPAQVINDNGTVVTLMNNGRRRKNGIKTKRKEGGHV